MTNEISKEAVVEDYLAFARAEDMEGAAAYLQECFSTGPESLDEEALEAFMKKVVTAAEAEVATEGTDTPDTTEEAINEATTDAEVQEATSES